MNKIDELCAIVARIEQKVDDMKPRCTSHEEDIAQHDIILRGGNGHAEGLCEKVRTIEKRHLAVSTIVPFAMLAVWEYVKNKIWQK